MENIIFGVEFIIGIILGVIALIVGYIIIAGLCMAIYTFIDGLIADFKERKNKQTE